MFNKLVSVALVALIGTSCATVQLIAVKAAVTTAVSLINDVTTLVTGMDGLINLIKNDKSTEIFQEQVTKKLDDIYTLCTGIDEVKGRIDHLSTVMKESNDKLRLGVITSVEFNSAKRIAGDFKKNVDYVDKIYFDKFTAVWNNMKNYRRGSVDNHIQALVSDSAFDRSLSDMLADITSSPNSQSSIFWALSKFYNTQNGYAFHCESISPLDDLHIFYGNVITTFARGYALLLTSYQHLKTNTNDYEFYQDRQNIAFKNFKEAIEAIIQHAKIDFGLIADTDYRASYSCDPYDWEEGKNFIRVKNYLSVQFSQNYWRNIADGEDDVHKPPANWKEYDCQSGWSEYEAGFGVEFDTKSFVCTTPFSPNLPNPYSVEYSEIEHPLNRIWESRRCGFGVTSYFYNYCERDLNSDSVLSIRKLSLRLQECDTSRNEVVTDARFHEQDNKIHIKIQCGVLKDGAIDIKTLRWNEDNKPFSESVPREYVVLSSKLKSFNLDNVVVPNGELVTGVGFKVVDDHFISLVVKANKVNNFYHGNTFGVDNLYSAPKSKKSRRNIDITLLERPLKKMEQTYEMSKTGETYINLTLSEWSHQYHNEAIVPYFDMTPYMKETNRWRTAAMVAPLGGMGLFYKSRPNHTGFLAFKHLSPTYIQFVDTIETRQSSLEKAQRPLNRYRRALALG